MKIFSNVIFLFFISFSLFSQNLLISKPYPEDYFRAPLDLPPSLAGSFGEIRSNHFHSGLDYRTNQREGYPVHAAADGYVSRLRVQVGGFGNAIYITHPNGYTTVYAHLKRFNPKIEQFVKNFQYANQSFDVDFILFPIDILIKKGEVIAWSGNTGSSGGPHLHFEIRDSKTEQTINPQLFGLQVPDKVKPTITGMYMYRLNGLPFNEHTPKQYFQVIGSGGNYKLNKLPVINFSGEVGFGIMTQDQNVPGGNQNGVYSIELLLDGTTIYASALEGFYFNNSRAVNSHLDYSSLLLYGRRIQKSFVEPGNPLTIYKNLVNRGLIKLDDSEIHDLTYMVKDAAGNTSKLSFQIRNNPKAELKSAEESTGVTTFYYDRDNTYTDEDLRILIPKGILYSDLQLKYSKSAKPVRGFSPVHHIHTRLIPVHDNYTLSIKADSSLSADLQEKAVIVDTRGFNFGGNYENGFVTTSLKTFGNFYISIDTIAPRIRSVNVSEGKSFSDTERMVFKISDNLSGIRSFNGTIDGQWILMEFDPKTATLWHTFDERTSKGKHQFQLTVTDMKLNTTTYHATIYR
ncbi:M23 family metallopeptidase [Rubrolithibacter danxiaensis]|uniref:M23 family metallopeptidase n=1 Tax=Rubrolithibacter danxiaensis TaxID=3390805 RepID=UPI003BF83804